MAKRHLFVSVGSTSATALAALIDRLIDLDIYKPLSEDYKDMFVAIDTDQIPLDRLEIYNQGKLAHTFGIRFTNSAYNVPTHKFLQNSFRPDWTTGDLAINAADRGVGGQRVKSFSTLEWKGELSRLIDKFYEGVNDTNQDCQVILVAATWGGTASGMFQNVADFLASRIYEKCGGSNSLTDFYTVLALPDFSSAQSEFGENYQGLENFVYLMRSIQQAGWRSSLYKLQNGELKDLKFLFPEFSDFLFGDTTRIPVKENAARFCGNLSPLPARAVIMIPAAQPETGTSVISEQLLLLSYLNIFERPYSANGASTATAEFVNMRRPGIGDDKVVVGINMAECQLKYGAEIREVVERRLYDGWRNFFSGEVSHDPNSVIFIRNFLDQSIKIPEDLLKKFVLPVLESFNSDSPDQINTLKERIADFHKAAKDMAYEFPCFDSDLFLKMDDYAETLPADDLLRESYNHDLVLSDVASSYREQLDKWRAEANEDVGAKIAKINKMIDHVAANYKQLSSKRGRNHFIIKYCNGTLEVPEEYIRLAREEIAAELRELQKLLLVKATVVKFNIVDNNRIIYDGNWTNVTTLFDRKKQISSAKARPRRSFIRKVDNPTLVQLLQNSALVSMKSSYFLRLMKSSGNVAALEATYDQVCSEMIQHVIGELSKVNRAQDCSMITLADADNIGGCSTAYQLGANDAIPPFMFHFYAKCAGAGDITWNDVSKLGFNSFLRCKNAGYAPTNKVSPDNINYNVGCGVWIDDQINYGGNRLPGMWVGSVDIGMTFNSVLAKSYTKDHFRRIQTQAFNLEGRKVQCCHTLFERISIGALLGIINAKLPKAGNDLAAGGNELSVSIRIGDDLKWNAKCRGDQVATLGFINSIDGCSVESVNASFIKEMMSWMRENDHGSCRFADAIGCKDLFTSLLNQENYVLEKMSLGPNEEQRKMILELYAKLQDCVEVTVTPCSK